MVTLLTPRSNRIIPTTWAPSWAMVSACPAISHRPSTRTRATASPVRAIAYDGGPVGTTTGVVSPCRDAAEASSVSTSPPRFPRPRHDVCHPGEGSFAEGADESGDGRRGSPLLLPRLPRRSRLSGRAGGAPAGASASGWAAACRPEHLLQPLARGVDVHQGRGPGELGV